jgi:hypothetical protein
VPADPATIAARVDALPWPDLQATLHAQGFAQTPTVLRSDECADLAALYETGRFRSTVVMARHRFGSGEYKYFDHPLPDAVVQLRRAFYPPLAQVANEWAEQLGEPTRYPDELDPFLERCHRAGQTRPTPLIFHYERGDWNALHQDLYGETAFPLQVVTVLNAPGDDFSGGEVVLVEQRPRTQSRAHVLPLQQGAFLIFPTRHRPVQGKRGFYRATMRHGVSTLTAGTRATLGIIFHDAE